MKKIHKYIMLFVMAFAVASCAEDEIIENNNSGKPGGDVQFGLSLHNSRTIYGPEGDSSFPIYWSEGDKILVASPQCSNPTAEYGVTPKAGQSYADALTRTGDAGVQWGSTDADFYSIYPSTGASWETISVNNVTANLNISSKQSANLVLDNGTYRAADMDNVIMYARTPEVKNGTTVNLQYTPYSTILEFEIAVGPVGENKVYGSAKVLSMTLESPIEITGDFSLQFNGDDAPTINTTGNNGKKITMEFETQPVLNKDNSLKAKIALIPLSDITSLTGWKVSITVLEGNEASTKTYTKTLTPSEVNDFSDLVPGQIHKIKLPKLTPSAEWKYELSSWMPSLYDYKNIYLTELSLPGAWYAGAPTDEGYQATADIATLWQSGVRAFAVECRTSSSEGFLTIGGGDPEDVVVSGTGKNSAGVLQDSYYYGGTQIRTVISNIVKSMNASEFAVLVLSYADGGKGGHREEDYNYFINGIKTEIANSGVTNKIYSQAITAGTTVNDVLGKLIIKINVDNKLPKGKYDNSMNALFSYNPFVQQLTIDDGETSIDYTKIRFSKIYWQTWEDGYRKFTTSNTDDFLWCFSSANRTQLNTGTDTTIPTYAQRQEALRGMIQHSKEISSSGGHNVWFYFNAGGVEATSQSDETTSATDFAPTMNSWLLEVVKLKANGGVDKNGVYGTAEAYVESEPSPLGIVMFNQCTGDNDTYHGADIIKEIVEMNNKFKLQRKGVVSKANYDSTVNDGGNLISLD